MITIFEGPDGAGKSTLIQAWRRWIEAHSRRTNVAVEHVVQQHGPYLGHTEVAKFYSHSMAMSVNPRRHVLMDRCWISEEIYGPIIRGSNRISNVEKQLLEKTAKDLGAVFIWCLPSYEACKTNYIKRKVLEYLENEDQLRKVYNLYRDYTLNQLMPASRMDSAFAIYNYEETESVSMFIDIVETTRPEAK